MLRRNKRKRKKKNPIYEIDLYLKYRPIEKIERVEEKIEEMRQTIIIIKILMKIEKER